MECWLPCCAGKCRPEATVVAFLVPCCAYGIFGKTHIKEGAQAQPSNALIIICTVFAIFGHMQDRIKYLMIFYRSTLKLAIGTGLLVAVWLCLTAPAAIPGTFFLCFPTIGLAMDAFYRFLSKKRSNEFHFYRNAGLGPVELYGCSFALSAAISFVSLILLSIFGL